MRCVGTCRSPPPPPLPQPPLSHPHGRGRERHAMGQRGFVGGFDLEANSDEGAPPPALDENAALRQQAGGDKFLVHLARDVRLSLATTVLVILRGFD
eukprot:4598883-Pleurochrysis_carterae.AAC.1